MMETEYIQSYCTLQNELDQAKNTLVTLNDNIRRIIGRDPKEIGRSEKYNDAKRSESERTTQKEMNTPHKRRSFDSKSVFNRLSAPTVRISDEEFKPRLNSRVIRELPSRQEIVAAQCSDAESRARNRRMFGSLLGTLHKFCVEESRLKQKEDKKAKIEKKLEEQELQEKASLKKERELLFFDRKRKQLEIRKLELKMSRLKDFEVWEASQNFLKNQIRTKTKPYIYFRPRVMNKNTEKMLLDSRNALSSEINQKKEAINKEIAEIEDRFRLQEDENDECKIDTYATKCIYNANNKGNTNLDEHEKIISPSNNHLFIADMQKKSNIDFKENDSRNVHEPSLSSSIVVVKNESPREATLLE